MTSYELETEIEKLIRMGFDSEAIKRTLSTSFDDEDVLNDSVDNICKTYPDYDLIQFFMKSKVVVDKDGEDETLYMYNVHNYELRTINKSRLLDIIDRKNLLWSSRRYTCHFVYDPSIFYKLDKIEEEWRYNIYNPPFWLEDTFHTSNKVKIAKQDELPEVYDKFFKHLVNNDKASYTYLINWLANMIQDRNYCILTTIGNQGIGKGLLGNIMKELVGSDNFAWTAKRAISKDFNGQMLNKKLVYLDEVKITTSDQENALKSLVNDYIEIEQKGKDAKLVRNFSSIYFSSNDLDSIRIPSDDRRFSIIELTDKKLITIMSKDEISSMLDEENIRTLAHYLFHKKFNAQKMMEVFRSARVQLLKSASLNRWQEWFIEDYIASNKGKVIPVKQVAKDIEDGCDIHNGPGRNKLMKFSELYTDLFEVKNVRCGSEMKWCVLIK